jgi:hypothetical protein
MEQHIILQDHQLVFIELNFKILLRIMQAGILKPLTFVKP